MSRLFAPLFFLAGLALSLQVYAQPQWQLIKSKQQIQSYKKQQTNSALLAFKAQATIRQPIARVVNILLDSDHAEDWIPKLVDSRILAPSNWPLNYTQYTKFDAPWPIRDRLFLSQVQVEVNPYNYTTTIHYLNTRPHYQEAGIIRGSAAGSIYTLSVNPDNTSFTDVIAISVADPNGSIPKWLVNWVGMNMPHNTMLQLQHMSTANTIAMQPEIAALYQNLKTAKLQQ